MSQHKIISRHQHGFLSRKSTTTQLLECCLDWNIALNGHNNLDVIYVDFAKHGRNPRGGQGGTIPPKILGGGDDIAHIPPINYPHSYEKLPFAWIIG